MKTTKINTQPQIIKVNGNVIAVEPANGKSFTLDEMRNCIGGGWIECFRLNKNMVMLMDEEGQLKKLPFNAKASEEAKALVVGDVLVCPATAVNAS